MQARAVPTFHYPTTVVFVDDNQDFLTNFSLQLDPGISCKLFSNPMQALQFLNNSPKNPVYESCYEDYKNALKNAEKINELPKLDKQIITSRLNSTDRFSEVSVALVDFDMPGMDGITFCKQIDNHHIKKILFTGVADEKVAVDAFNQGIIDRFILKQDSSALEKVNQMLLSIQNNYFDEISQIFKNSISFNDIAPTFVNDIAFEDLFHALNKQHAIVEYYITLEPNGFLMVNAGGKIFRLIIMNEIDLESHLDIASDQNAPEKLIQQMASREVIPYFWDSSDGFYHHAIINWEKYVFPAKTLNGKRLYHYSLIEEPANLSEFKSYLIDYQSFVEQAHD